MQWIACPPTPLAWIEFRELLLQLLYSPALLLPLVALAAALLAWRLRLSRARLLAFVLLLPLAISTIYSPEATTLLEAWLHQQMPAPGAPTTAVPVVVLVGRGSDMAAATTAAAAERFGQGVVSAVYVSGDDRSTAERLLQLGIEPSRIAGDSCARTTWENATLTNRWLRQHHPGAPVLLITDSWQLPRAARAFEQQGLQVIPIAADPTLSPSQHNRLALRETAATLLYSLQGRM
ncbi:YdcF family protein [Synechococcus sp. CS-1325]|uniref:YdcF family protein n=1 Tax=unclassified Synechococcus TaxID=2626047 RepID=UPI000DB08725|nr:MULTISPECIES: YdcF family protein [unclassified Synechococcus]PZV03018.1 MAG: YdcF family protein [Cyanobium sp.]MCT0199409.1 YdcF family protein [Synechococcus sp. CS-1325]MCT0214467.1 YdcF family protein [Synechococcus sp. CS-1326]MCT0231768.1 YdcF family protein [Synechococcus sp. CS-1324]MCT0233230.1 YdcF family protein [Synechococcus sp. CS-1327]